jgi:hypothetical protein
MRASDGRHQSRYKTVNHEKATGSEAAEKLENITEYTAEHSVGQQSTHVLFWPVGEN